LYAPVGALSLRRLFAAGLGILGLLGWRTKQRASNLPTVERERPVAVRMARGWTEKLAAGDFPPECCGHATPRPFV
jgi:hypothetical protein